MLLMFGVTLPSAYASSLKKGGLLTEARAQLIKRGWRPVDRRAWEAYEPIGVETELRAARIMEVESCAIDRPLCIFSY